MELTRKVSRATRLPHPRVDLFDLRRSKHDHAIERSSARDPGSSRRASARLRGVFPVTVAASGSARVDIWDGLPQQERVVSLLRGAIERDRAPHAYLFSGPVGAPLMDTALALAAALNCEVANGEGCGECDSCAKIIGGIHPDVVTLVREGAANIVPIESVRTQVLGPIGLPPHEALVRMFIVEEATAMAPPAANALLKTLEEPPAPSRT